MLILAAGSSRLFTVFMSVLGQLKHPRFSPSDRESVFSGFAGSISGIDALFRHAFARRMRAHEVDSRAKYKRVVLKLSGEVLRGGKSGDWRRQQV